MKRYENMEVVTIGVLIADGRQSEAREYILQYMNRFDEHSGDYFDFCIPGYYEGNDGTNGEMAHKYHPNSCVRFEETNDRPLFKIRRNNTRYYFDEELFEDFLSVIEQKMGVRYTYNPMLYTV